MATEGRSRKLIIGLVVAASIIMGKLFYIQIIEDKYKINASNNSMVYDIIYPTRGIIYDRNGQIIVGNKVAYDILVTPKEVTPFDTLMLADALGVSPDFIRDKMAEYARNRRKIVWYRKNSQLLIWEPFIIWRNCRIMNICSVISIRWNRQQR